MKLNLRLAWLLRFFKNRPFLLLCLAGVSVILAFYGVENWRGRRVWKGYVQETTAQGLHVEWESCIPKPVPNEDNFAMTPLLAEWYAINPRYGIPSLPARIERITADIHTNRLDFADGDWIRGGHASLTRCLTNYYRENEGAAIPPAVAKRFNLKPDAFLNDPNTSEIAVRYYRDPRVPTLVLRYSQLSARDQAQEILERLESLEPVWDELRATMRRPYSRYPVRYNRKSVLEIEYGPHISVVRSLASILRLSAICHLELGQAEPALADLELGFRLSNSVKTDPWLVSYLARCHADHLLTQAIWEGTSRHLWSAKQLERLQQLRTPGNEIAEARRILLCARAIGIRMLEETVKDRKNWTSMLRSDPSFRTKIAGLCLLCAPQGWFEWEKINLSKRYDEFVPKVFQLPTARVSTNECARMAAWWKTSASWFHAYWNHRIFAGMLSPQLDKLARQVAREQTAVDLAYLGCALERYWLEKGKWPGRLEDLVPRYVPKLACDVLTGEPYRYRLADKNGYVLYSIGIDGKDNGGTAHYDPANKQTGYDGDWLWYGGGDVLPNNVVKSSASAPE